MISFEITGKLNIGKETDKFKPYREEEYKSGWVNRTLIFNAISGTNRLSLQTKSGCFKDGHGDLYLFGKDYVDENGKKFKGAAFTIPFKDRFDEKKIAETVEWKKFVIDLEIPNRRWKLQNAADRLKDGRTISAEELKEVGLESADQINEALEKSKKKRKEFLSAYDYAEFLYKMLTSDKYQDKKFTIRGNYEMQYSEEKQRWYNNYVPNRIYLAADDAEETATANVVLFFSEDSLMDAVEEKGKYYVNGYVQVYDNNRKANIFAPYTIAIDATENEKKVKKLVDMFTVEGEEVRELGVVVALLDGAQKKEIKMEDLDEETQDNILCGLVEFEDVVKSLGGTVYSDRIQENRFVKLGRGFAAGSKDTIYNVDDLTIKSLSNKNVFEDKEDDDTDSLFEEDDDLDLFS